MSQLDTREVEKGLATEVGDLGLAYLAPQIQIMRQARKLAKEVEDEQLWTAQFYLGLKLIELWAEPLQLVVDAELGELERELASLQDQARFLLESSNTRSWAEAMNHSNPRVPELLKAIESTRSVVMERRHQLLTESTRAEITNLLGLVLYGYSPDVKSLEDAVRLAQQTYFGPNRRYNKGDKYADAMIFAKAAKDVLTTARVATTGGIGEDYKVLFKGSLVVDPEIEVVRDIYRQAKEGNFSFHGLSMKQVTMLWSKVLMRPMNPVERNMVNNDFYMPSLDRYRVDLIFKHLAREILGDQALHDVAKFETSAAEQGRTQGNYLFGLSFLDKHKNQEILGNIPESSFGLIEAVLSVFHELKQAGAFMEAAGFELTSQIYGLPEQSWLYDFTSVKSEILRSTMLLLADRVPKFDLLEACQRLATAVLGGRVDRNDLRIGEPGFTRNYIQTDLLPEPSHKFIAEALVEVLEEAMVREEDTAARIIKQIFREEDRSHLVTSKRFRSVYFQRITMAISEEGQYSPLTLRTYVAENFKYEYRHAQTGGYPWYFEENRLFQMLVADAMKTDIPDQTIQLRRVISNIDGVKYIFFYQAAKGDPGKVLLNTLAFMEVPEFEEGITPVEVLFRPAKFMTIYANPDHKDNDLRLLLDDVRATDPKDLEALISNIGVD